MSNKIPMEKIESRLEQMEDYEKYIQERNRFNVGLVWGILLGLIANMWTTLVYEDLIKDLDLIFRLSILFVLTVFLLGVAYMITKDIKKGQDFAKTIDKCKPILKAYKKRNKKEGN